MKKLIKADLGDILRLVPIYQPTDPARIEGNIAALNKGEETDYLFLARREKSFLFSLPAVYAPDTYENLAWTYGLSTPHVLPLALLLHISKVVNGRPTGTVTLLDYTALARDVDIYCALPESVRQRHIDLILKRNARQTRYCSVLELIEFLSVRGENKWM